MPSSFTNSSKCFCNFTQQDAQMAIPKGTLIAIAMTSVSYAGLAILLGTVMSREATGSIADLVAGNFTSACLEGVECKYGLLNDFSGRYF